MSTVATRKTKVPASVPYEPWLKRRLATDPEQATLYLQAAIQEALKANDPRIFQVALKDVAEAHGGVTSLARETGLNRQHLYRVMSRTGNPSFAGLWQMLRAFGLGFSVIEVEEKTQRFREPHLTGTRT
jgi:probable addiction module antidote protein